MKEFWKNISCRHVVFIARFIEFMLRRQPHILSFLIWANYPIWWAIGRISSARIIFLQWSIDRKVKASYCSIPIADLVLFVSHCKGFAFKNSSLPENRKTYTNDKGTTWCADDYFCKRRIINFLCVIICLRHVCLELKIWLNFK